MRIVKACAQKAGVRRGRVSAHDLRRAFAREFLRNGGDLESLRQLLGHSSYAMVRRYAELASDVVARSHQGASLPTTCIWSKGVSAPSSP
ncbi:MAG: tyrosine-type recombinase/integrase [bacterium]